MISTRRKLDGEARADDHRVTILLGRRLGPVLRPDATAMRFDDLFRNGKTQTRVLTEIAVIAAIGVKSFEDSFKLI